MRCAEALQAELRKREAEEVKAEGRRGMSTHAESRSD